MDYIQFFSEVIISVVKHGWSATTLIIFIFALFKFAPFRRFVMRSLPRKLRVLDNRMDSMDVRMKRMESKIDAIMSAGGVKWVAVETTSLKSITPTARNSSPFGWATVFPAVTVRLRTMARHLLSKNTAIKQSSLTGRKQTMTKDLLSGKKKFVALIIAVLVNGLNDVLGLGLSGDTLETTTYISGGFIVIEGVLDVVRALSNHFLKKNNTGVTVNEEFKTSTEHFE